MFKVKAEACYVETRLCTVACASYFEDMFVDNDFGLATAAAISGSRVWAGAYTGSHFRST